MDQFIISILSVSCEVYKVAFAQLGEASSWKALLFHRTPILELTPGVKHTAHTCTFPALPLAPVPHTQAKYMQPELTSCCRKALTPPSPSQRVQEGSYGLSLQKKINYNLSVQ